MRRILAILAVAIFLVTGALTNPSVGAHAKAILSRDPALGAAAGALSLVGGSRYRNYAICSTVTVNGQPVTFGAFGRVLMLSRLPLR